MAWLVFIFAVGASAGAVRLARGIGVRRALLDRPNERSSHTIPVPRLGGAALVPVLLCAVVLLWRTSDWSRPRLVFLAGAGVLFAIGLIDDLLSVSRVARLALQASVAAAMVVVTYRHWVADGSPFVIVMMTVVVGTGIVGVLNIYNFMDGIDGLAGLQAVVAGLAWAIIGATAGAVAAHAIGMATAAAAAGFLTSNWPPAKIFMGDAGSTVLGFIFAVLPLLAASEILAPLSPGAALATPEFASLGGAGLLALFPFLADGGFTLGRRLVRRENVFAAHRSHVYQRLVISGLKHRTVTSLYGVEALLGAGAAVALVRQQPIAAAAAAIVALAGFTALWRWAVARESARDQ